MITLTVFTVLEVIVILTEQHSVSLGLKQADVTFG